jgi:hypothetical protein
MALTEPDIDYFELKIIQLTVCVMIGKRSLVNLYPERERYTASACSPKYLAIPIQMDGHDPINMIP